MKNIKTKYEIVSILILCLITFNVYLTSTLFNNQKELNKKVDEYIELNTEFTQTEFYLRNQIALSNIKQLTDLESTEKDTVIMFNMDGCSACEKEYSEIAKVKDNLKFNLKFININSSKLFGLTQEAHELFSNNDELYYQHLIDFNETNDFSKLYIYRTPTYLIYTKSKGTWCIGSGSGYFKTIINNY